ncbi:hypothetical protein GCM10009547_23710 [Sporichthya brevicatena]|uniref:Copper chaperone PCu(A)C n=1 Tax=Sporichthya brevicatena TaxID=171442 RepID=A0ABN1GUY7_9ACTN
MHVRTLPAALGAAALTLTLSLTACGQDDDAPAGSAAGEATVAATPSPSAAAVLTPADLWVKAAPSGMTAAFGTLINPGTSDLTVVGATTDIGARCELHETVADGDGAMVMRPKEGGFVIPAGGRFELEPGGNHLMIMELTRELRTGEIVSISWKLSDGSTIESEAVVKPFSGAEEKYEPGGAM